MIQFYRHLLLTKGLLRKVKNLFGKKRSVAEIQEFTGTGTVLVGNIINISKLLEHFDHEDLVKILKQHLNHVITRIEKYSGVVFRFEGDTVVSFWPPYQTNPNHAQLAFDASCEILESLPTIVIKGERVTYHVELILGTGEMVGGFFGTTKQFEIVGEAMAITDYLSKTRKATDSLIRMSQSTVDQIKSPEDLKETEIINLDDMKDLRVFSYRPPSKG